MPDTAAELLFQVIAGRAERAAVIVTTNLPGLFSTFLPCTALMNRGPKSLKRQSLTSLIP
jgi:hypothetical protein